MFCWLLSVFSINVHWEGRWGRGISPSQPWLPHGYQDVAQLLPLPVGVHLRAHPLVDELMHALVFGHPEHLHGTLLMGVKSHTS